MCLRDDPSLDNPKIQIEYRDKCVPCSEKDIASAIESATAEIAGNWNCIPDMPLALVIRKKGVPDLTMVDLPGIHCAPDHGQRDQVAAIIMKYLNLMESIIILNVLPANVHLPTSESIRLSKQVDLTGERTLMVVTKADESPKCLLEKVTVGDVNINGLGYVCVRNRIGSETFEEAREAEKKLFDSHPLLSKIDKSNVGFPVLAQRLMKIQARCIAKYMPDIVKKINEKLSRNMSEMEEIKKDQTYLGEAINVCLSIATKMNETHRKLFLKGEFEDYPNHDEMHCSDRLNEMLIEYSKKLLDRDFSVKKDGFLMKEITALEEVRGSASPNSLSRAAFLNLLQRKVEKISKIPCNLVLKVWRYVEDVVLRILEDTVLRIFEDSEADNYLYPFLRRDLQNLIEKKRHKSLKAVKKFIEMEMMTDRTHNPEYKKLLEKLMLGQEEFMDVIKNTSKPTKINIKGIGEIDVSHLQGMPVELVEQAFEIKMRLISYWKCAVIRLVDLLDLHILYSIRNLVEETFALEILKRIFRDTAKAKVELQELAERMRDRRKKSIQFLEESKEVVAKIMGMTGFP